MKLFFFFLLLIANAYANPNYLIFPQNVIDQSYRENEYFFQKMYSELYNKNLQQVKLETENNELKKCMSLNDIRRELKSRITNLPDVPLKIRKQVVVAVIDSGIDLLNPTLLNHLFVPKSVKNLNELDFSKTSLQDDNGHGTHVSGLILAVFPHAKILPLKYFNNQMSDDAILKASVAALNYAVDQKVDIINYSGGGNGTSLLEREALDRAEKAGILIVTAAGNEFNNLDNPTIAYYPASYRLKNMITVGNANYDNVIDFSSNYGENTVDLFAYGVSSFSYGLKTSKYYNCSDKITGSSQATPLVTGLLSLILATNPRLSSLAAKQLLLESTDSVGSLKKYSKYGRALSFRKWSNSF